MSVLHRKFAGLVHALRGALEWHAECGDTHLTVPRGFQAPGLGKTAVTVTPLANKESVEASSTNHFDQLESDDRRPLSVDPNTRDTEPKSTPSTKGSFSAFKQPQHVKPCWQVIPIDTQVEGSEMGQKAASLQAIRDQIAEGALCPAHCNHTEIVYGQGNPGARLMIIGDAPGPREDVLGLPFVDEAGALLGKMIRAMGLKRNDTYLTYLVKCHASAADMETHLDTWASVIATEIQVVKPDVIIALGELAARRLTGRGDAFPHIRGRWFDYEGIPVLPTFHPHALLQNPKCKQQVWTDLKSVMRNLGLQSPSDTAAPRAQR